MPDVLLPPIDIYRRPFIEPLGHLALHAAALDNALIELCSSVQGTTEDMQATAAIAKKLHNWTGETKSYVQSILATIADAHHRERALAVLDRSVELRNERHRAVHDSIEVGVVGDSVSGYEAIALQVGFPRTSGRTFHKVSTVTPEQIAKLAYELYDLTADTEAISYFLGQSTT